MMSHIREAPYLGSDSGQSPPRQHSGCGFGSEAIAADKCREALTKLVYLLTVLASQLHLKCNDVTLLSLSSQSSYEPHLVL